MRGEPSVLFPCSVKWLGCGLPVFCEAGWLDPVLRAFRPLTICMPSPRVRLCCDVPFAALRYRYVSCAVVCLVQFDDLWVRYSFYGVCVTAVYFDHVPCVCECRLLTLITTVCRDVVC